MSRKIYSIIHVSSGKSLTAMTTRSYFETNSDVILDTYTGADNQKWIVDDGIGDGKIVRSLHACNYGLNTYRSGTDWNCDVHRILLNETDATFNFLLVSGSNLYNIIPTNYTSRKLTAKTVDSTYQAVWSTESLPTSQVWQVTELGDYYTPYFGTLSLPVTYNQKYIGNTAWVKANGCSVCCVASIASYFDAPNVHTIQEMFDVGACTTSGVVWRNVPKSNVTKTFGPANTSVITYQDSDFLPVMKNEIDGGHPVIVILGKLNSAGTAFADSFHYVIAYSYSANGENLSNFTVYDPYNSDTSQTSAKSKTLPQAISDNNKTRIYKLRYSSSK